MPLSIREIRENTAAARRLMKRSRNEKFAVGAFSLDNQETLRALCRAALVKKSPIIIESGHEEIKSIGIENIRDLVNNYKKELKIEIYLGLSFSPTLEDAIVGIENGFEFIHIDIASAERQASTDEIIGKTKMVADYARLTGALVESTDFKNPPQNSGYEEIKKSFSSPANAESFIKATGIDIYAAAVGNLPDDIVGPKTLDLKLLKSIQAAVDSGISLHGGTAVPAHYFQDAVKLGVNKIGVSSEMRSAFRDSLERELKQNPDEIAVSKFMDQVIGSVQKVAEEKIDLFGSTGKARI